MRTIEVFKLEELKERAPDAYARVHERWKEDVRADPDVPWADEVMESIRAVFDACGARLADWSIGPWSRCYIDVEMDEEDENGKEKDANWYRREVLKPNGYIKPNGFAHFPGNCVFTGYCFDDDALEEVWRALKAGESLRKALGRLAALAGRHMEDAVEQQEEEGSMLANWSHLEFTEDGTEI